MTEKKVFEFDAQQIPTDAGCYLFKNADEKIIYIGKAKNLRKRVSSYFLKNEKSPKTASMVKRIQHIETRAVSSEMESLILENTLIKKHKPKYNILLRDDKNFLYLRVTKSDLPKIEITRRLISDGSIYIGPRTSAKSFRTTVGFCQKFFGAKMVDAKKDNYVAKMLGKELSDEAYRDNIKKMIKFLRGDTAEVLKDLQVKMMDFAKEKNFEAAAKTRDLIVSIQGSAQKQIIEFEQTVSRDVIGMVRQGSTAYFVRLVFRNGKFVDQAEIKISAPDFAEDAQVLGQFLQQFYAYVDSFPKEILLPFLPDSDTELNDYLSATRNEKISIRQEIPYQGDKQKVVEIAQKNALNFAEKTRITELTQSENFVKALPELAEKLALPSIRRMECYDISHFAGQETVASQVVFVDGKPAKSEYRRYKMKTLAPGEIDDFKSMREVLGRRFSAFSGAKLASSQVSKLASEVEIKLVESAADKKLVENKIHEIFLAAYGDDMRNEEPIKPEQVVFSVKQNNELIGGLIGKRAVDNTWKISMIAVEKEFQNQGLGKKLMSAYEDFVRKNNGEKIYLVSRSEARKAYEVFGFNVLQNPTDAQLDNLDKVRSEFPNGEFFLMEKLILPLKVELNKDEIIFRSPKNESEKLELLKFGDEIFSQELSWPATEEFDEKYFDESQYIFVGCYDSNGKILGIVKVKKFLKSMVQIAGLAVDKSVRGKDIATKLIQHIVPEILEFGAKKIFVLSDVGAEKFYQKFRFEINEKPLKKIEKYISEMSEKFSETNTIWKSYEWKISLPEEKVSKDPDLIVIDGGKGQLSAVLETLKKFENLPLDIETQVIALAKQEEEVFRGKFVDGELKFELINVPNTSAASLLLQRIRDEAHRFAISFNRNLRAKKLVKSALDEVPGIGGVTKKKLLAEIGSVSEIRNAEDEDLLKILNKKQLESLRKNL